MEITSYQDHEEFIEDPSPWDVKIPLGLLIFGLFVLAIHGFVTAGARGGGSVLVGIGALLLVYLPVTLVAMFIAASILEINFGELGPAALKIAGIFVFIAALRDVVGTVGHPIVGWVVGLVASLFLYGKAFRLRAIETIGAVLVVAAVQMILGWGIGSLIVRLGAS